MKKQNSILYTVIILVFFCGFFLYYFGISKEVYSGNLPVDTMNTVLHSLYYATAMFFFNNDFSNIEEVYRQNPMYYFGFWFIHILAVLSTITTVLFLFRREVKNYFRLFRAFWVKRYVVWGVNDESIIFIKNLLLNNSKLKFEIIVAIDENRNVALEEIENLDVAYVFTSIDDPKLNKKLYVSTPQKKTTHILIFGSNAINNLNKASAISKSQKKEETNELLSIILDADSDDWINFYSKDIKCNLKTFNKADIIARQFLTICPPHSFVKVDSEKAKAISDYTILIIGFGHTGQQLLLKILSHAQYEDAKFKAIVIDRDMSKLKGRFERNYTGLCKNYDINFWEADVGSEEFNSLIDNEIFNIDTIICCMREDEKNIETGLELNKKITNINNLKVKILLKCTKQNEFIQKIHNDIIVNENINFFGSLKEVYTPEVIIDEELDKLAEGINNHYNKYNPKYVCNWSEITPFLKNTNRHPAQHIFAKLHLVGLRACKKNNAYSQMEIINTKAEFLDFLGEKRLMALARFEHLRWKAFHYANGWDTLPLDGATKWKDNIKKRHTCIVSWDELDEVSNKFDDDYKLKNIQHVENIIDYLKSTDFIVYK